MFEKSLSDLVRGIRNHRGDESRYIAHCVEEIKGELRQDNMPMKANAVAKLIYLQMLGYDVSWAAFNIIEVMSSSKFIFKRIGYLAASQTFHDDTDVLMLTTNMIRKDLSSQNMYEAGVALTGLSCFVSPDLARDLANDVMTLLASTKPFLRKKSILLMYKIFLKFPDALRPAFGRLKDKVDDPDPGVQCAAVNVICELARKNPKNYLSMAPVFFKLMTSSSNNWMLIKIIKLFGALTPLEPRLGKKLIDPLTNLIHSTSAMSLLCECINTIVAGMPNHTASIQLCVSKLRVMIEDPDQNLKYLGLRAFAQILKHHPKVVSSHKDLVLECLEDRDESIRIRALDLLYGMVTKKNISDIVKKLMSHIDKAEGQMYRDEVLAKVIEICVQSNYQHVTNFEWYITVLVELTRIEGTRHGRLIANSLMDVAIRVKSVRPFAVKQMGVLLDNAHLLRGTGQRNSICEVLFAASWICGEFAGMLANPRAAIEAMLKPQSTTLPGHIQAVFVQNVVKLYAFIMKENMGEDGDEDEVADVRALLEGSLPMFVQSGDLEVQERACSVMQLIKYIKKSQEKGQDITAEVIALFDGEMNPVAPKAQKKVPVPEGLDLDKWINDPPSESEDEPEASFGDAFFGEKEEVRTKSKRETMEEEEEMERRREARRQAKMSNPHYLPVTASSSKKSESAALVEGIPVTAIQLDIPLTLEPSSGKKKKGKKGKKGRKGRRGDDDDDDFTGARPVVATAVDMPDDAAQSDADEDSKLALDDPHRALADISLDEPLRDDEVLPVRTHRVVPDRPTGHEAPVKKKKKKSKESAKDERKKKKKKKRQEEDVDDEATGGNLVAVDDEAPAAEAPRIKKGKKARADADASVSVSQPAATAAPKNDMDDLSFWLSSSDAPAASAAAAPAVDAAAPVAEATPAVEEKKKKRSKKGEKEEKGKRKKKSKAAAAEAVVENGSALSDQAALSEVASGVSASRQQQAMAAYVPLAKDKIIELSCQMRVALQQPNQVIASVLFRSHAEQQLSNLEFNVLDSLNTKMIRPMGVKSHEGIAVPFQLPPGSANEAQFAFTIDNITVPQKLRGTLTYMIQMPDGATSAKIDFKIPMPCSSFVFPMPITSKAFAGLLASGELCEAKSTKATWTKTVDFSTALASICGNLHFAVIEVLDGSASLHGCSIQQHHVCMLVKATPDHGGLSVNCKATDAALASNIIDEVKAFV